MRAILSLLLLVSAPAFSASGWEVAVLFLGAREPAEYQADIDENILELARVIPGRNLGLSILREFPDRTVAYFPDPASSRLQSWDPLFHQVPAPGIRVPGVMTVGEGGQILSDTASLRRFLRSAFRKNDSQRLLLIYAHGEGHEGLRSIPLPALRNALLDAVPPRRGRKPLDLFWLNSCFMANVETHWELAPITDLMLSSQDAEFSAGAPFEVLNSIEGKSPQEAGHILGFRYLESYSFLRKGSQRRSVFESASTISLVSTEKLRNLKNALRAMGGKSSPSRGRMERGRMAKSGLVDLGYAAHVVGATAVESTLELGKSGKRHTTPRIYIPVPTPGARLVFGYENWTLGHRSDAGTLEKLPQSLEPQGFYSRGPRGKDWPFRRGERRIQVAPFAPGLNLFHFFFAAPDADRIVSSESFFRRTQDVFTFLAGRSDNPVLFSGHTEGKGQAAELYTGLNVWNPLAPTPSTEYLDLSFFRDTGWGAR
ncbi:MAG: hypothetical protein HUU37_09180 [Bdellovibrionales bacterium]|nr:hypothetical protein [Bdellovibrionales bacterium]